VTRGKYDSRMMSSVAKLLWTLLWSYCYIYCFYFAI